MRELRSALLFVFLSLFLISAHAQIKPSGGVGIRFMTTGGGGSSSVSGSNLFTGHTSSSSAPEFFIRVHPTNLSPSIPENFAIEGTMSLAESEHEIKFNGASLGKKTCSQAMGVSAQWHFGESSSKVRPYVGLGFETKDCGGDYAIGGARFAQSESSSNSAIFRAGINFDLTHIFKGLSASIDMKTSSKHESIGNPVAGVSVKNDTGGGISAGVGVNLRF